MKGMNQPNIHIQDRNPLPAKRVRPRKKKYLEIKRQREIDAMVELTRNQLMDRYEG
ncbi:MAG: hypothetical protein HOG63_10420 [Nitrospina sp.]|jgi:hypothetical protein|nr:hypothetical protein [Nitrospina sp.]MBT3416244.1 hypothetical protein [Nitrospina sp.]MBT3857068.1 hypothetical protein [Nitrospina sp.]MBT4104397.1 hypothetical protein [Nitrospina sp.]MBT4389934.1 hypothetical protein [Nitrospina sp.]